MSNVASAREFRNAFGTFATGVTVITACLPNGKPIGITANSFASVSLQPPLVSWCIAKESRSIEAFAKDANFSVTILGEHEEKVAMHFAGRTSIKFPDGAFADPKGPSPTVPGEHLCRLECVVAAIHPAGDHLIIVGEVRELAVQDGKPLIFQGGRFGTFRPDDAPSVPFNIWECPGTDLPWALREAFD